MVNASTEQDVCVGGGSPPGRVITGVLNLPSCPPRALFNAYRTSPPFNGIVVCGGRFVPQGPVPSGYVVTAVFTSASGCVQTGRRIDALRYNVATDGLTICAGGVLPGFSSGLNSAGSFVVTRVLHVDLCGPQTQLQPRNAYVIKEPFDGMVVCSGVGLNVNAVGGQEVGAVPPNYVVTRVLRRDPDCARFGNRRNATQYRLAPQ
jgi:hypothetical protein